MPHCQVLRLLDYHIKVSSAAGLKQYSLTFTIFVLQSESQNWSCVNLILHDDKKKKTFCSSGTDRNKTTIYFYPRSTKTSMNSNVL